MSVIRVCDAMLDSVVVVLSSWTIIYHICLVSNLSVEWAIGLELLLLGFIGVWWWYPRVPPRPTFGEDNGEGSSVTGPRLRVSLLPALCAFLALAAAFAMASGVAWVFVWVPFLAAAVLAAVSVGLSWQQRDEPRELRPEAPARGRTTVENKASWTAWLAVGWGLALAALSSVIVRPNPDDLFYVNVSQWVAHSGTFPVRDTIFSDLKYPMANWPPTASYDGLVGAVAHLVDIRAATVGYVVVTPLVTFLAVLALWRLLRAWRVRHLSVTLSAALVFLLVDGSSGYGSPGNLFLTRAWQGKVVLLCVLVPLLLVYALAFVDKPSRRGAIRLFLAGVAATALSTTAIFLTPVLALAGAAPLLLRGRWRAGTVGLVAMAAYPLMAAAVTLILGGRSADDFGIRRLFRFDPEFFGHEIFLSGIVAGIGVTSVLLGCLFLPHPAARLTTAVLVVATAVTFVPGVTELGYATVGLGPTLWRISWGATIAALVGVLFAELLSRLRRRQTQLIVSAISIALLLSLATPIWSASTSSSFAAPLQWKRGAETRSVTQWLIESTRPGDVVLAPDSVSITVAVSTTQIKTVAPRAYYMDYLRADPSFHFAERLMLVEFANGPDEADGVHEADGAGDNSATAGSLRRSLRVLNVRAACLDAEDIRGLEVLRAAGYSDSFSTERYRCVLRRTPDPTG